MIQFLCHYFKLTPLLDYFCVYIKLMINVGVKQNNEV